MTTVTLSINEYQDLKKKASIYEMMENFFIQQNLFSSPPTKSKKKILKEFKETGMYNKKFIDSLEKGLSRSRYFST